MIPYLVHHFLEQSAERYPDKPALFSNKEWHSYAEIESRANKLAHLFKECGVRPGDRIGFYLENSIEYVVTYYAILKTGAVTVSINTELLNDSVEFVVKDCGIEFFVTSPKLFRKVQTLFKRKEKPQLFIWNAPQTFAEVTATSPILLPQQVEGQDATRPSDNVIDLDLASIVYTSGSTGKPRGVTLTHLNIATNTRSIVQYLALTEHDRMMVILPFYYIYGKSLLNTHFFVGGSVVVDNRFMYPNVILKTMVEQEVTGFSGVPSTFSILLNRSNIRSLQFNHLRYLTQAGGAMAPAVQKEVAELFAPAKLYIMYGATEASARLSYLHPDMLAHKWGSIGKAIPNVELFIVDEKGNRVPTGSEGEIVARGANIMQGYWNQPEETKKVLKNGLYYTGDLGVADEDGFLYVVGRNRDMIKVGGNRVGTKEIEEIIFELPFVEDVAVIGVPDEIMGESPKAFVVVKETNNAQQLEEKILAHCKAKLAVYKLPKFIEFKSALPKNKAGKTQKLKLTEL